MFVNIAKKFNMLKENIIHTQQLFLLNEEKKEKNVYNNYHCHNTFCLTLDQ